MLYMNNGEWITDRKPTADDAHISGCVWTTYKGKVVPWGYDGVADGTPWMPITPPEPYGKPKSVRVVEEQRYGGNGWEYAVIFGIGTVARHIPTKEAAERIAAIYEEVVT